MNLAINKSLEEQKVLNESKSLELKSALKNLDLANIKISDFEIRVASLIARRTQLISEIAQKDNRIKEEVSRLEASRLALASARQEIDEKVVRGVMKQAGVRMALKGRGKDKVTGVRQNAIVIRYEV